MKNLLYLFLLLLVACTDKKSDSERSYGAERVAGVFSRYVSRTDYNSYAVVPAGRLHGFDSLRNGVLVGPFYQKLINDLKTSDIEFLGEYANRRFYLLTSSPNKTITSEVPDISFCNADSFPAASDNDYLYKDNGLISFLRESILIYHDKESLIINQSPDTLVLPKINVETLK